jgi:hypothetical protein
MPPRMRNQVQPPNEMQDQLLLLLEQHVKDLSNLPITINLIRIHNSINDLLIWMIQVQRMIRMMI